MSDDSTRDIIIGMLEKLTEKVNSVDARLIALEAKQYDTHPIWQAVEARLERLEEKLDHLSDKFDVVNDHLTSTQADVRSLKRRMNELEGQRP